MSLQIRRSKICSLQSDNYIITLRLYDIIYKIYAEQEMRTEMDGTPDGSNPDNYGIDSAEYMISRHGLHYRLC